MKTIVIIGAGPGLGLSIAKKFGANGFQAALVARNAEKLSLMVYELKALGINTKYYVADISELPALKAAIDAIKHDFGSIDVLEFSPYAGPHQFRNVMDTTPTNVLEQINGHLLPAILAVNEWLPDMIQQGAGAILFTTGISAMQPIPMIGNVGIVMSGLRNYATNLHNELKEKGIYVGHLSIGTLIQSGTAGDPDRIADVWFDMYEKRDHFENVFPEGLFQSN
ncbi:SDR family NAD(P)-dependent oxidoreductase [Paenibacillus hodogayensis]|uniref:SDR family NAD(P)-dependent oxidoreductase n=1 Tax=Paenibacillus hodogayensis TaxID=279208 RepID=A0ABV5W0D2_9BACL